MDPHPAPFRLLVATRNAGKLAEIRQILAGHPVSVLSVDDVPGAPDVEEHEPTLEGNALLKADALHALTGLATIADDTGLEVDALGGRPGVRSARYAGEAADPVANRRLLLEELAGRTERTARFRCVIAFVDGTRRRTFEGACEGVILESERGSGGFGYDALFRPLGFERSFAELDAREKNAISHRGRALAAFAAWLFPPEGPSAW